MTEPSYLADTRASYDKIAPNYAERIQPLFADWALGRAMLAAFAEIVRPTQLPVADVGFHRVLAPGGHLALGFHVGDGLKHFKLTMKGERRPQASLLAGKPG